MTLKGPDHTVRNLFFKYLDGKLWNTGLWVWLYCYTTVLIDSYLRWKCLIKFILCERVGMLCLNRRIKRRFGIILLLRYNSRKRKLSTRALHELRKDATYKTTKTCYIENNLKDMGLQHRKRAASNNTRQGLKSLEIKELFY